MQLPLRWNTEICTTEVQSTGCKRYQICLECLGIYFPLLSLPPCIGRTSFLSNPHLLSLYYPSPSWRANRYQVEPLNDRFVFCFSAGDKISSKLELFYGNEMIFLKWNFVSATAEVLFGPCWVDTDAECFFVSWELWWLKLKEVKREGQVF